MDQVRLITAIVLSVIIFAVWNYFYAPKPKPPVKDLKQTSGEVVTNPSKKSVSPEIKSQIKDKPVSTKLLPESFKIIETPLYKVKISDRGAVIKSFKLKKYKKTNKKDSGLFDLLETDKDLKSIDLKFSDKYLSDSSDSSFECEMKEDYIEIKNKFSLNFRFVSSSGIILNKEYTFYPDSYLLDIDISVLNKSDDIVGGEYSLSISDNAASGSMYAFEGPTVKIDNSITEIKTKKIKKKDTYTGKIDWIAMQDRYFINVLVPAESSDEASMKLVLKDSVVTSSYKSVLKPIKPGENFRIKFSNYEGPKKISILKSPKINSELDLSDAVSFGWFDIVAKPCLYVMNYIHSHLISNYGVSIIILTLFIKLCFWPLATKSYKSMAEMKKLQPVIAELKEKYKGDSKKMNMEMMNLYKVYKVNPFSGCFPLVIQMPIFIALYRMLYSAVELRHAPFFAWITDLSAPERLFDFGVSIPYMHPPIGIPVLTIIMGATMFIQQKMSPSAGDPAQAKMMMFMPLFLMVVFINFSSGLVLYWLVNNVISIAQQYYINKKLA